MSYHHLKFSLDPNTYERVINLMGEWNPALSENISVRGYVKGSVPMYSAELDKTEVLITFRTPKGINWPGLVQSKNWEIDEEEIKALVGFAEIAANVKTQQVEDSWGISSITIPGIMFTIEVDEKEFARFVDFIIHAKKDIRGRIILNDMGQTDHNRGRPDDLIQSEQKFYPLTFVELN